MQKAIFSNELNLHCSFSTSQFHYRLDELIPIFRHDDAEIVIWVEPLSFSFLLADDNGLENVTDFLLGKRQNNFLVSSNLYFYSAICFSIQVSLNLSWRLCWIESLRGRERDLEREDGVGDGNGNGDGDRVGAGAEARAPLTLLTGWLAGLNTKRGEMCANINVEKKLARNKNKTFRALS